MKLNALWLFSFPSNKTIFLLPCVSPWYRPTHTTTPQFQMADLYVPPELVLGQATFCFSYVCLKGKHSCLKAACSELKAHGTLQRSALKMTLLSPFTFRMEKLCCSNISIVLRLIYLKSERLRPKAQTLWTESVVFTWRTGSDILASAETFSQGAPDSCE